ncbi:MAG: glycosyltransferase family 2 protein [Pseudomonadota bacterium]
MRSGARIVCIIPALNEERAIGRVIADIPEWVDQVVVADNGSTDRTAEVAQAHGADVVLQPERGYGAACLAGIDAVDPSDVIVFLDGDYSDRPAEMLRLVDPIVRDSADMVVGSRVLGNRERGALTLPQVFGNWLATRLIRTFWGVRYTDLGPFRAIRTTSLRSLEMADRNFGWTVEMQIKAAMQNLRTCEVPVSYARRIGVSKISGTIRGSVMAGIVILSTIGRAALRPPTGPSTEANPRQPSVAT